MIITNINKRDDEHIEYNFSMDEYKGVIFAVLVKIDILENEDGSFLTADYDELTHIKHNDPSFTIDPKESKILCDAFVTSILNNLIEDLKKL